MEQPNNQEVNIRMIPLNTFINVLVELYNKGVDYIDLVGAQGEEKDYMAITFTKEYMSEAGKENFKEVTEDQEIELDTFKKLSDEDLNELI